MGTEENRSRSSRSGWHESGSARELFSHYRCGQNQKKPPKLSLDGAPSKVNSGQEFRPGQPPIGEVDGSDQDSLNRRFNVTSLLVSRIASFRITTFRISRQACAGQHGNVISRENGHAV